MISVPVDVPDVLRRSINKHCHGRACAWLLLLLLCVGCASTPAVTSQDAQAPSRQAGPAEQSITEEAVPSQEQEQPALQNRSLSTTPATEVPREPITIRKLKQIDTRGSAAAPKTAKPSDASAKQKIALDFDDADIFEVINALSDILNINYIIDPAVRGKVNIHTTGEIDKSQLLPILDTIFKINNIAAVKTGDLYKIIPIKDTKSAVSDVSIGTDLSAIPATDRVIIQIVPLRYIPSAEAVKVLKPFISPGGDIQEYSKGNILIIVDASANVQKLLSFIDVLDVDTFEQTQVRFFKAKNADVKDLAKELESLFTSLGFAKATDKGIGISFIPVERASCVLAVSSVPGIFEKVEHWVSVLDTVDTGAEAQVFVYYLENAKAEELAGVLGSLYGEGKADTRTGRQPQTPERQRRGESMSSMSSRDRSRGSRSRDREPLSRRKEAGTAGSAGFAGMLQGELTIVTDETTNSLIIKALPADYVAIKETIQKLDIVPKQVLIEVLIAEVRMSGDTQFGVEWALRDANASLGGYKGQSRTEMDFGLGGVGADLAKGLGQGFSYRFSSNQLQAFLVAQASQNKLNILASPQIMVADNKEARIEVGEEVPIVTSEYVPLTTENVDQTSRNIEYRNTGVILEVTPRINDKGLVALDISQEVSKAQKIEAGGIQSPTITNRKAETSLVVQNATTVVIGGLIGAESGKTVRGVPFLSSIPILGYFFSSTGQTKAKSELIILITPHVVTNINEAAAISMEFKEKVSQIKKLLNKSEDKALQSYKE
jgi:general secretion pathway protein D